MTQYPGPLYHELPHWVSANAQYHIRLRIGKTTQGRPGVPATALIGRLDAPVTAKALISSAQNYHQKGLWWCSLILLMPDHVHGMFTFPPEKGMSQTIRDWKRLTAKTLNIDWQPNYFDHRLRSPKESDETWSYIRANPVCAALCDWPWWWSALSPTR